ncbi:unnamed protein product [Lampetra planeri]
MEERSGLSSFAWRRATLHHLPLLLLHLLLLVTAASALQSAAASGGDPVAEGPGFAARPLTPVHLRAHVTLPEGHLAFLLHTANPHAELFRNASARLLQAPFVMLGARGVRPLSEPRVNATFGPFRVSRPIPPELLGPSLGGWSDGPRGGSDAASSSSSGGGGGPAGGGSGQAARLRAVLVQEKVYSSSPKVQVLFHATGRDWDDHSDIASLPCVHLHAFRETREARGSCRLDTNLGLCLAGLALPLAWFAPPTVVPGRRQRPLGESQAAARVELYFSVRPAEADGSCRGDEARQQQQRAGGGVSSRRGRDDPDTRQHHRPLLRIGSVGLLLSPPSPPVTESRLEGGVALLVPEKSFRPGEVISVTVTLPRNSTLERFTLRAKAKKGIEVLGAQPVDPSAWELSSDIINSGKHHVVAVAATRRQPGRSLAVGEEAAVAVLRVDFAMGNFTSQSVTRRILWQLELHGAKRTASASSSSSSSTSSSTSSPDSERVMTELTAMQKDIVAIVPVAMDTELVNTAALSGRTVAVPVRVLSVESSGALADVSGFVECSSASPDTVKVSDGCDYVYVNGKESKGSLAARVRFSYEHLSATLTVAVWLPRLPLTVLLSDSQLQQVKGWRAPRGAAAAVPVPPPVTDGAGAAGAAEERRGRGCTLLSQRATVRVLARFEAEASEGSGLRTPMLGPDWLLDVSEVVARAGLVRVANPAVAEVRQQAGLVVIAREAGVTAVQVVSPLSEGVHGEAPLSVLEERVALAALRLLLVGGLSLTVGAAPGPLPAVLASVAAQRLHAHKQEAVLSAWLEFSDDTAAPLDIYDPGSFSLTLTSLDESVVSVRPPAPRGGRGDGDPWAGPTVTAEGEGRGDLLRAELGVPDVCQKSKRRSGVVAASTCAVNVKFGAAAAGDDYGDYGGDADGDPPGGDRRPPPPPISSPPPGLPEPDEQREAVMTSEDDDDDNEVGNDAVRTEVPPPPSPRSLTDLEIGMYALLAVFCLAIAVFLVNCLTFALRYRGAGGKKAHGAGGPAAAAAGAAANGNERCPSGAKPRRPHDWVWLNQPQPRSPTPTDVTPTDGGGPPGRGGRSDAAPLGPGGGGGGGDVDGGGGGVGNGVAEASLNSPTSKRKRVKFTTFAAGAPDAAAAAPSASSPLPPPRPPPSPPAVGASAEDLEWVCRDMGLREPDAFRNYMERIKERV